MDRKYLVIILICFLVACDIRKAESGEVPTIEVDKGKLPKYDLEWAKVRVTTRTRKVKVPRVVVVMEEREVDVPVLDFEMPGADQELVERTISVEAEVSERMYDLQIRRVYASENRLIVVSELRAIDAPLDGEHVRIADQIIINAPENLVVDHYIIGEEPDGVFNGDYKFVRSASMVDVSGATMLYER